MHWKALFDADGPALRYVEDIREGTPIADLACVTNGRTALESARTAIAQLPGWLLATSDTRLAEQLLHSGAARTRHAVIMQCDVREHPGAEPASPALALQSLPTDPDPVHWQHILPSWRDAFPAEHPDHFPGDDALAIAFILRLVRGSELGPMHRSSTLLVDGDGRALAGIMVNVRPQDPPMGGPWIADIWRDPQLRGTGIGPLLIGRAKRLLAEDGFASLCLAVTAGNDARRTYEAEGFRVVTESHTLQLPGRLSPS